MCAFYRSFSALTAFMALALPLTAQAQVKGDARLDIDARATFQYISEENRDLGTGGDDREDSLSEQLQVMVGADVTDELFGFIHGRALNVDGETGFDDDTGTAVPLDQSFFELREAYLKKNELFGIVPMSLQVGRQRVRESRALWWNSDNDLVRLNYDSTLFSGFLAAGENFSSYRTGSGRELQQDDQGRFRTLGESSWQYSYNHFLEGRFLYEDDHSGLEAPGRIVAAADRDNQDQQVLWAGVRARGEVRDPVPAASNLKYRADLIGVAGEEDNLTTVAGPGADFRTVTGSASRDVRAWAFDGGVTVDPMAAGGTMFSAGYAFGSGDDGAGDDTSFRQTDIQGNSSRIGLERQQQRNYGEVLRPELSNIHILSASANHPLFDASDISLTYFYYRLDDDATGLRSSGVTAPLNGTDKFLGQAVDIAFNVDIDEEFGIQAPYTRDMDFRFVVGNFFPGDAYDPAGDSNALRIFTELKMAF